ncbi:MAG: PilW family protein [Granulosicoccus sp.]
MKTNLHRISGFSLIELMIAMVLGIVIVGGCISIFSGVIRSSTLNQTVSNLQSNARFALDILGHDVRAAGFLGCSSNRNTGLNVTVDNPPTTNLSLSAVTGYLVKEGSWTPAAPVSYTAATSIGKPVPGTHALSVHYADFPGFVLRASMETVSSDIELNPGDASRLYDGQLMVISDCNSADLFSIAGVTSTSAKLTLEPDSSLQKRYKVSASSPNAARAMPFVSTIYYVGDTQRDSESGDDVYSLFAHSYPYTTANPPLELIEGVDQLVLEFGVRQTDGSLLYVTADSVNYRAEGIETVRLGLLLSSTERFSDVNATRTYILAGQTIGAQTSIPESTGNTAGNNPGDGTPEATSLTYPGDTRLRMPFNATFNVRNRNI